MMKHYKLKSILKNYLKEQTSEKWNDDIRDPGPPEPGHNIGCTNPEAINYDPGPDVMSCPNDDCCIFDISPPDHVGTKKLGCKDKNDAAYCPECVADTVPTSCSGKKALDRRPGKKGCRDKTACNYDPDAEQGSHEEFCEYPNECDSCEGDTSCLGCTDPHANNYNPNATVDDGSCVGGKGDPMDTDDDLVPLNKKCHWWGALNYNEDCLADPTTGLYGPNAIVSDIVPFYHPDEKGEGCCDFSQFNVGPEHSYVPHPNPLAVGARYVLGPCHSMFNYGGTTGGANTDDFPIPYNSSFYGCPDTGCCGGENCGQENECIIDNLQQNIGSELQSIFGPVCGGAQDAALINGAIQTYSNAIENYAQYTTQGATLSDSYLGTNYLNTTAVQGVENLGNWVGETGDALDLNNISVGGVNLNTVLNACNQMGDNIIGFVADMIGVGGAWSVVETVLCGIQNILDGDQGCDDMMPCCSSGEWSMYCHGGAQGVINTYGNMYPQSLYNANAFVEFGLAYVNAWNPDYFSAGTATGPWGELNGSGVGYCNNGYQPTTPGFTGADYDVIDEQKKILKENQEISKKSYLLRKKLQERAGLKKRG